MDLATIRNEMQVAPAVMQANTSIANIEQSRAVAEVQGSIVLAKANPRNEHSAVNSILNSCKRSSLAESATYAFRRGGEMVTGPSIRLAEVLARHWGNINYGFREIGRMEGCSEVEAFAHDLETNVKVTRQFQVKHWRDTKQGGKEVTAERDKYELVANMAQRRVRSCLLELIPGDIVEAAEEACKATLMNNIGNVDDQCKKIVAAFAELQVTAEMIEGLLQRKITSIVPADIVNLKRIYRSIRDGIASADEFFKSGDVEKLNERFGKVSPQKNQPEPDIRNPSPPPETKKPSSSHAEKPENEPQTKLSNDLGPVEPSPQEQSQITPPSKVVKTFMGEINRASEGGSVAIDQWRLKHHKRAANTCGGDQSDDYKKIMEYVDMVFRELVESEREQQAAGGKQNGNLF